MGVNTKPSSRPRKAESLGQLAREGHQVVQFKDNETKRFIAMAVHGEVKEYGSRHR
jgi:hypothetical protein